MEALKGFKIAITLLVAGIVALVVMVFLLTGKLMQKQGPTTTAPPSASSPPSASGGPALDRIRARGVLLVGMDTGTVEGQGSPPMYFTNADGAPDGFDVAIAKRVAGALGVGDVRFVHAGYSDLPGQLVSQPDAFDLFIAGYIPTTIPGVSWSDPYLEFGLCLSVATDSQVRTINDLFGKPVGIFEDEAAAVEVQKLVKGYTELKQYNDGYWDKLLAGEIAGFIYDYPFAVAEIKQFYEEKPQYLGKIKISQYNLTDSTYAVGVRSSEPELLAAVNQAIASLRSSPAYETMVKTYLAAPGSSPEELAAEAMAAREAGGRTYEVVSGDTFGSIAQKELGSADRWRDIWALNKNRIPNPNLLEVGQVLKLP